MQVYVNERYVGDLNHHHGDEVRHIRMHFVNQPTDLFLDEGVRIEDAVVSHIDFAVKTRACSLPISGWNERDDVVLMEHARRRYNIPADAKVWKDKDMMSGDTLVRWKWHAIECPLDTYDDHMFDHPQFEPV